MLPGNPVKIVINIHIRSGKHVKKKIQHGFLRILFLLHQSMICPMGLLSKCSNITKNKEYGTKNSSILPSPKTTFPLVGSVLGDYNLTAG